MRDSRPIGIRLSNKLWDLVRSANPGLTYSEIVKRALEKEYGFVTFEKESVIEEKKVVSVEEKIDLLLKKKRGED